MKTVTVKVKYLKPHPKDAYFEGDIAEISAEKAAERLKSGHVMPLPDEDDEDLNPLPEDFPAREILYKEGFDTIEMILAAGEGLTDIKGVGKGTLKAIEKWVEENKGKE